MKHLALLLFTLTLLGCESKSKQNDTTPAGRNSDTLKYATGFSISREGNNVFLTVHNPYQGAQSGYSYLLVPHGQPVPAHDPSQKVIRTPISTIACTSTTHIPFLDYLDETDKLVGFPSTDLVSSEKARARIDGGKVKDLGKDKGLNLELLAALQPDMLMGYTMSSDYGQFKKIEELGIPVIINSEYLEQHPLGRAEWIKFMALFFGKEKEADSVFATIENSYLETMRHAQQKTRRPTVLSGIMYGDAWFLPGGKNYASTILHDAACEYLWASDSTSGYLELSFEAVYQKANQCDLWIGVATYTTREQLAGANQRYKLFKAFTDNAIYNYDNRMGAKGGNEFLELGYLRPDLILKDLVKIAHPDLLPTHELFFYRRLE